MTKKRILYVATVDEHIRAFHLPYLKMMHNLGWEVHVATNGKEKFPYCDKKHTICMERSPYRLNNLKAIKQMKELLKKEHFDIIHCHTPMGSAITRIAAKKARKEGSRIIYTSHGFHFYKGAPLINWIIFYTVEKALSKHTDVIFTINREDYEISRKKFKKTHVEYIPGIGVDDEKINSIVKTQDINKTRKKLGFTKNDFLMIYTARLDKNKNQLMLIEAMEQLVNSYKNIHLLLVGKDELNGHYQSIVNKKHLEEHVHFLGFRKDIYKLMNASDLAVSASSREGLGISLIEASILKKGLIATHNRGHNEIITEGVNGYFADSVNEFVKKISYIINNKPTLNHENISKFTLKNALEKTAIIYGVQLNKTNSIPGLISILMGTYNNSKKHLSESIESILYQTYSNWELIICDDGSIKDPAVLIDKYKKRYPNKIKFIKNGTNKGLNYTLNHCMQYAHGEFIARQDADDISTPDRFEKEINFLRKNKDYSFVSSNMFYFDEKGIWGKSAQAEYPERIDFVKGSPFCHAPVLIYKSAIEDVNYYTISNYLLRVEDYHLWFKLYSRGYKGANIVEPLYKMRDDNNASKRRTWSNRINEFHAKKIGFKMLKIPKKYNIYKYRSIIVGLLPRPLYNYLHKKSIKRIDNENLEG